MRFAIHMGNCYGEINDGLNNGLPTDRFKVEWWIDSEHIKTPTPLMKTSIGNIPWEMTNDDLPKLGDFDSVLNVGECINTSSSEFSNFKKEKISSLRLTGE